MRILLAHNYYGSLAPSGENQVFQMESALLSGRGHEVIEFTRHSDELWSKGVVGAVQGALSVPWNPWMAHAARRKVEDFRPDIVHVHNTFPSLSPAIFHAVGRCGARLLTLHNYRLFCPAAIPMRKGKVCTECLDQHSAWPALKYGCYRGSRMATLPLVVSVSLHRKIETWTKHVDAFIALSEFQRDRMIMAGLPADRVYVKPNFYAGNPVAVAWNEREDYVVFAGRLSAEKGIETLVRAWLVWGKRAPELRVVGDGPLREQMHRLTTLRPEVPIRWLGQLSSADAEQQIARAKLLALPSEWFEGFPMVIREAFAFGTPAAVSNIGPLPSIVNHGFSGVVFQPGDVDSLFGEVRRAWETPGLLQRLSEGARRSFENSYTEARNYETLMDIYEHALATHRGREKGK